MQKWRFFLTGIAAAALLIIPILSHAVCSHPYIPYGSKEYGLRVEVEADFLYWKPCISNLDLAAVVTESDGEIDVDYKYLCSDWQPGLRVVVSIPNIFYGWDFSASYYRLNYEDSTSQSFSAPDEENGIISPFIFTGGNFPDTWAEGEESIDLFYHEWDLLLKVDICHTPCRKFASYFGIAALFLNQEVEGDFEREDFIDEEESISKELEIEWKSDFSGVGIRIGARYDWKLCDCISFFTNAHFTLLIGEATTTNVQILTETNESDVTISFADDECPQLVPGYHIAAGLSYISCLCGWEYAIRVGYEFVNWHNLTNHRVFNGDNLNTETGFSTSPRTRTMGFHGFFAGVSTCF